MCDDKQALSVLLVVPDEGAAAHVRRLLGQVPPPGTIVVDACFSESRALQRYFQLRPDVVVFDCRTVPDEPARFVGLIKRMAPGSCIVAVVSEPDSCAASAALRLGADRIGCLDELPRMVGGLVLAS